MALSLRGIAAAIFLSLHSAADATAGGAPAAVLAGKTAIETRIGGGLAIALALTRDVEHRVFTLGEPNRLVIDLRDTELAALSPQFAAGMAEVTALRSGLFRPGWSRLVFDLARPLAVETAVFQGHQLTVLLREADQADFDAKSGAPADALWDAPVSAGIAGLRSRAMQEGPVIVALDPGHGGIDPGAVRDGVSEKDLALTFALELGAVLERSGDYAVFLTRDQDIFVSLRDRVELARRANADVFLSIHANTVATGDVSGATVYSLSGEASDESARQLAEFENQSDIFAGADYQGDEDQVALALIDLARVETDARSRNLGEAFLQGLRSTVGVTRNHPNWSADLRVLKAPDMPSLLLELGFLSSAIDRANLQSPAWRERAAAGIVAALDTWVAQDRAVAGMRQ